MKQTNKLGGEIVHVVSSSYLLLLCMGPKYGGMLMVHHSSSTERSLCSSQRREEYTAAYYEEELCYIDDRRVANAKVRVWYLSLFFSVIIRTVSRRVFFFLRNKFQRTNISIVIQFKISPRVVFSKLVLENQRSFVLGICEEKKTIWFGFNIKGDKLPSKIDDLKFKTTVMWYIFEPKFPSLLKFQSFDAFFAIQK